jgi:phosphatidylserine/phosphatidylglycerophosphate/cardiolipin synthase-like enzyme
MEDARYTTELIRRWQAGVPVRVLVDTKANSRYPANAHRIAELRDAGIPIRRRTASYMHWKTMIFAGQNVVQFSGANYSPHAFVPVEPYVDYVDEVIVFSDDPAIVGSFKTKYDDAWTATSGWSDYANVTTPRTRSHATAPIHPDLNFPPGSGQNFATRSVAMYEAEDAAIESIMYRITDALIGAVARGVVARVLTEPFQYREPERLWHAWNVDRMYVAGVQIRHRRHLGLNHEKLTLLTEEGMAIIGSSNWTESSANAQNEHNWFTREAWVVDWSRAHFDRKWQSDAETEPFVPLPTSRRPSRSGGMAGTGRTATTSTSAPTRRR